MQTYLVHMRRPRRLWRELGARRFIGFQVLMAGMILSSLVHPWFYVLIALDAWHGSLLAVPEGVFGQWLLGIGVINLIAGYVSAIALGTVAAARLTGHGWGNAAALGALMNTRGLMGLIVLNIGLSMGVISPTLFAMMVLMALATTMATAPLLQFLIPAPPQPGAPPRDPTPAAGRVPSPAATVTRTP